MDGSSSVSILAVAISPESIGVIVWLAGAAAIAWAMRVYRPRSIVGPERLGYDESFLILTYILGAGIVGGNIAALAAHHALAGFPAALVLAAGTALFYVGGATGLVALSMALRGSDWIRLGIGWRRIGIGIAGGVTGLLVIFPLFILVDYFEKIYLNHLKIVAPAHQALQLLSQTNDRRVFFLTAGTAVVFAPFGEELAFRGAAQTALGRIYASLIAAVRGVPCVGTNSPARWAAVVTTSALFASVHSQTGSWGPLFVLAVGLGYLYEWTGNLWSVVTAHGLLNLTSIVIYLHGNPS